MAEYPTIENSSGCVFCDLDLATKEHEGAHIHQVTAYANDGLRHTMFIPCPVKNKT